jgi:hypothetical protein
MDLKQVGKKKVYKRAAITFGLIEEFLDKLPMERTFTTNDVRSYVRREEQRLSTQGAVGIFNYLKLLVSPLQKYNKIKPYWIEIILPADGCFAWKMRRARYAKLFHDLKTPEVQDGTKFLRPADLPQQRELPFDNTVLLAEKIGKLTEALWPLSKIIQAQVQPEAAAKQSLTSFRENVISLEVKPEGRA